MGNFVFRPIYMDLVCNVILFLIFFTSLFLTDGIWFVFDIILLAGTGVLLGRTVGNIHTGNY